MSEAPVAALGAALGAALEGVLEGVSLRLGGRQVLARPQDCAMVFQAPRLLRWRRWARTWGWRWPIAGA